MLDNDASNEPWYKQFWPWFLLILPLTAVVAGITTIFIAQNNAVALVSDNYYKDGLAINQNKLLEQKAAELGIIAELLVTSGSSICTIQLSGKHNNPSEIKLTLLHPTLPNLDQQIQLLKTSNNVYQVDCTLPMKGKWYVSITNPKRTWEIKQYAFLPNL